MNRPHLFEIEDLYFIPNWWRDYMTDCLERMMSISKFYLGTVPLLARLLSISSSKAIIDFGSGAGGPILSVLPELKRKFPELRVVLSDKFPNQAAVTRANQNACEFSDSISYVPESVDMTVPPVELSGVRTMFTSFHHLPVLEAEKVLAKAAADSACIGIFEFTGRSVLHWLMVMVVPFFILAITPFMKPFRIGRYLTTYLIPLVPVGCVWDGLISNWRTLSEDEFSRLSSKYQTKYYKFECGRFSTPLLVRGVYLLGYPVRGS